jgi:hypothetical protein
LVAAAPSGLDAQRGLSQVEALRLAFPEPASVERRTAFLSDSSRAAAQVLAGADVEIPSGIVTYYVGRAPSGDVIGTAYFDAHRVRTLPEVLMIVVDPRDRVERIEVLRFAEPPDYRPGAAWLDLVEGRALDESLSLRGAVPNMTGATLTAHAVVRAARRVLALHRVIGGAGQ